MKKNKEQSKKFSQAINLNGLETLNDIVFNNYDAFAHAYSYKKTKSNKKQRFEYYNLFCTCVLRIRETSLYLSSFEFKGKNTYGQAFDFYEFINCLSVVFSCAESLLKIFDIDLSNYLKAKEFFAKSNKTKESDYKFFKFIRSAAVAHPDNTSRYTKIAKRNNEIYPYAVWTSEVFDILMTDDNKNADISLLSWASSTKSSYKRYYLYVDEFYGFINAVVHCIENAIPKAEKIASSYKEKHRCKRLKKESGFCNYHEYLLYLRNRLLKLNTDKYEFPDGGLLIADHIISNPFISNNFKEYLKKRVSILQQMMIEKYDEIGFDTIFEELNLYDVIKDKCEDPHYVDQKFYLYLNREARYEIENSMYSKFIPELAIYRDNPQSGSDAFWAVYLLFSCKLFLDRFKSFEKYGEFSYADIFEMSLELIFEKTVEKK